VIKFGESTMQKPDQPIVIQVDDNILQRQESPFCGVDPTQGCHEDPELLAAVADAVNDGLLTPYEASLVIAGKTL
jgi:Ni2+-binding GTPase involved in maturation of urease and hydrogenase